MYLIDTHCHLNFNAFDNDLSDVVRRVDYSREVGNYSRLLVQYTQ